MQSVPKELVVETTLSADEIQQLVSDLTGVDDGVFVLRGSNGGRVIVPADKLAYVEIDESGGKSVGFGSF